MPELAAIALILAGGTICGSLLWTGVSAILAERRYQREARYRMGLGFGLPREE